MTSESDDSDNSDDDFNKKKKKNDEFDDILRGQSVYVNHNRRSQPLWHAFMTAFPASSQMSKVIHTLGAWEMASNAFHFVDLASYYLNSCPRSISSNGLADEWEPSQTRKNMYTCRGELTTSFVNGSTLILRNSSDPVSLVEFYDHSGELVATVDEVNGRFFVGKDLIAHCDIYNWSLMCPRIIKDLLIFGVTNLKSSDMWFRH